MAPDRQFRLLATLTLHDFVEGSVIARSRRSRKNVAVFMAASFSATVVATNWLKLVPSSLARRTTSALTEVGRRSG